MALSSEESDIQIISDHFTSQQPAIENGTPVPVHNRFRMFASDRLSSPQVNPASYHAFQKAYDDLKARYNDVSERNTQLERQLRTFRGRNEQSGMANSRQRHSEEMLNSDEREDREDSLQLRRKYFELSQEYRSQVEETSSLRQELLKAKKRISELENTNRGLLMDNQRMTASVNTVERKTQISGADQQQVEILSKRVRELEASCRESNQKCVELQQELSRTKTDEQAYNDELKALTSQVRGILQARISDAVTDENDWATLVKFQLEAAAKEMSDMATVIRQQQVLLQQLLCYASSGDGRKRHTFPKVMTRSAPSPSMLETDPDDVSVEYPSNAEHFPIILQPRQMRETSRNQRILSNITEATLEMSNSNHTNQIASSQAQNAGNSGLPLERSTSVHRRSKDQSRLSNSTNPFNTYQRAQQCSDDVFFENVKERKDAIVQEYMDEQRNSPMVQSPTARFHNPWISREPVGTVFGTAPTEHMVPDDIAAGDLQLRPPASQASLEMEEQHSLRRDVPAVNHGRPEHEEGDFSFMDDYRTTVQRLEDAGQENRARFAFELNDENRRHPAAFNQQPRQLNIDRNYSEDARRTGSYDNTAASRNINLASNAQIVDKHGDTGYASANNPPVLNNDPLWTPKTVPSQNLYKGHEQQVPERRSTPSNHPPEVERTCPVCDRDFPATVPQNEIESHVDTCLANSMHEEEAAATWTNAAATGRVAPAVPNASGPEEKKCPVCLHQFPQDTPLASLEHHINSHFENQPLNFEILDT